jgi:soluble lytic murein transglycosylase-like protein
VFGATAIFVPHAGKAPPPRIAVPSFAAAAVPALVPLVTVGMEFSLPPEWAYDDLIREAAQTFKIDAALVRAVVRTESAFDANAVSEAGAQGLMQLMPELALELGVEDPFDPRQNIMAGTRYLSQLLTTYDGNVTLALASYNAGPGAVELYGGVPPFPETQQYVKTITDLLAQ